LTAGSTLVDVQFDKFPTVRAIQIERFVHWFCASTATVGDGVKTRPGR
jgi:hypothetical protein